jgi:hypothetical protein
MDKTERYNEIVQEMFQMLFDCRDSGNYSAIERKLQELLMTLNRHQADEIALYLRSCAVEKNNLPTWQMLLLRGIELGKMQGIDTDDAFMGLLAYK